MALKGHRRHPRPHPRRAHPHPRRAHPHPRRRHPRRRRRLHENDNDLQITNRGGCSKVIAVVIIIMITVFYCSPMNIRCKLYDHVHNPSLLIILSDTLRHYLILSYFDDYLILYYLEHYLIRHLAPPITPSATFVLPQGRPTSTLD